MTARLLCASTLSGSEARASRELARGRYQGARIEVRLAEGECQGRSLALRAQAKGLLVSDAQLQGRSARCALARGHRAVGGWGRRRAEVLERLVEAAERAIRPLGVGAGEDSLATFADGEHVCAGLVPRRQKNRHPDPSHPDRGKRRACGAEEEA